MPLSGFSASHQTSYRLAAQQRGSGIEEDEAMIQQDVLQKFPELFGKKKVNGRELSVEEAIATLTREVRPAIAAVLTERRELLESPAPVRQKYAWPKWEDRFDDPVSGKAWT